MKTLKPGKFQLEIGVRWLIDSDMPKVLDIEKQSFPTPWTKFEFKAFLRAINGIAIIAEHKTVILGFAVYSIDEDQVTIANLAVHPHYRRLGIGRALVGKMQASLFDKRPSLTALVSERNLEAQLFYSALGFLAVDWFRGMFEPDDGIGMTFERAKASGLPLVSRRV